ncbi:flagellin N-terminal helical domain-containing protein [Parasedimentitalea psychrophila]|uniref:Flagellin n=1 Tax=Parasedimentitalea psychrophila TaxID=2997337 RepID=A0A9Y2KZ69_9RHOB|nr:flagellin [Parasedimentitalea psychrophila]WIY25149.1 flagellin [Parasedimentitalea psychrophila]
MSSINSNSGAAVALQMLGGTVEQKETVQEDIATGKEVNTAKDAAALWAISQVMESDVAGFSAVSGSLSLGEATASVAAVGAERMTEVLQDMKQLTIMASSGAVDYSKIETQMAHKTEQLNSIISSTQFNGVNLLKTDTDGTGSTSLTVAASFDRQGSGTASLATISVDSLDFEGSPSFDINNRTAITDQASAQTALGEIEGFLKYAIEGAAALGASATQMSDQNDFVGRLADSMKVGISAMTDTNMEQASVRLAALTVQQQLGSLSLSIANAAPNSLLALT